MSGNKRIFLFLICVLVIGCTIRQTSQIRQSSRHAEYTLVIDEQTKQEALYLNDVMEEVAKRNLSIEKDPDWINQSYAGLKIRSLYDIPREKYAYYSQFVDSGKIYVVVHPAYYTFFHKHKNTLKRSSDNMQSNMVDLFLQKKYKDPELRLVQQQQKNEKNFIEYATTEKKLLILVLPRDYKKYKHYTYKKGPDEYARYLNEITNGSDSVVYMESKSSTNGRLLATDLILLLHFMKDTGAQSVLIGGGYVGRCQKDFYNYLSSYAQKGNFFIVPEISIFSPADLTDETALDFMDSNMLDLQKISSFTVSMTSGRTNLQHLSPGYMFSVLSISPVSYSNANNSSATGQDNSAQNQKNNQKR